MNTNAPRRILVIRLSAIGDNVMATPLIGCLREAYPQAEISWLVESQSRELLASHPELHEVIVWPRRAWVQDFRQRRYRQLWRNATAFRRYLRAQKFDLVIDAQGLLKSGLLAWLTGAPRRVGLGSREGSQWLMHQVVSRRNDHPLISGEYHDLALALGLPVENFRLSLAIPEEATQRAKELVDAQGLKSGFAVLIPFTTRPQKHWVESRWAPIADQLATQFQLPAVMLGGPADGEAAERIADAVQPRTRLIKLAGNECLSLIDAAALIGQASLVIGVDTGMTHMASALQRPTVALFGSTVPYTDALAPQTRILFHSLPCAPCNKHPTCGGAFSCMDLLSVRQVMQAVEALLFEQRQAA